jgi:hypothetical protein
LGDHRKWSKKTNLEENGGKLKKMNGGNNKHCKENT